MNVTELARKLKINTTELLEILPEYGFDIGKKAIKIDNQIARKVIDKWPEIRRDLLIKEEKAKKEALEAAGIQEEAITEAEIPSILTVRDFAARINKPVNEVIKALMKSGLMLSLNEKIDFDTATIVADDFGVKVTKAKSSEDQIDTTSKIKDIIKNTQENTLENRPPVVVIMGHVDHGKTKLLDTIRTTNIIDTEAGGITQHIGAYQVKRKDHLLTFIDTPGHEAFTALRSRGAKIADIAILVIAADDGIKPQTMEAIKIIKQAQLPMIVAINKIDKPEANIEKVKQELAQQNLIPEDWGGKTICVPISAKEGTGIDDILDTLILVNDMEQDKIKANLATNACGTVIESNVDKGEGPVATVLVQNGTLKLNDQLTINGVYYGKVRAMKDYLSKNINQALPSTPARILGFKYAPQVGDIVEVQDKIERKNKKAKPSLNVMEAKASNQTKDSRKDTNKTYLNIILKTDVLGSLEVISESLAKLEKPEVKISVVSQGLGNVNDSDILMAEGSNALILGFHVDAIDTAADLAREKNIQIHTFKIIYELLDFVQNKLKEILPKEIIRTDLGELEILAIFKQEKDGWIVGGKVIKGKVILQPNKETLFEILHNDIKVNQGKLLQLQSGKQNVTEVLENQEAGIKIQLLEDFLEKGDILKFYQEETK